MPRRSAMTSGNTVAWPWPVLPTLSVSRSLPVSGKLSLALSVGAPPACSSMQEMPRPRYLPRFSEFQRLVEHRAEIAGIVSGADRGFIRHRGALDEVSPPQLDRIDAGDARGLV